MNTRAHQQTPADRGGSHERHAGRGRTRPDWRDDAGMATTEYALVTVAAAGFAGLLIALLKSSEARELLYGIVRSALGG